MFCNIFTADLQKDLDGDRSVTAESINSIINKGAPCIAYLHSSNVHPIMKFIFGNVNATALVRVITGIDVLEEKDVWKHISAYFTASVRTARKKASRSYTLFLTVFPSLIGTTSVCCYKMSVSIVSYLSPVPFKLRFLSIFGVLFISKFGTCSDEVVSSFTPASCHTLPEC